MQSREQRVRNETRSARTRSVLASKRARAPGVMQGTACKVDDLFPPLHAAKRVRADAAPASTSAQGACRGTPPAAEAPRESRAESYDSDDEVLFQRAKRQLREATCKAGSNSKIRPSSCQRAAAPAQASQPPAVVLDRAAARGESGREADAAEAAARAKVIADAAAEARLARDAAKRKREEDEARQRAAAAARVAEAAAAAAAAAARAAEAAAAAKPGFAAGDDFGFFGAAGNGGARAAPAAAAAAPNADAVPRKKRVRGTDAFYAALNALAAKLGGVPSPMDPALAALCANTALSQGTSVAQALQYLRNKKKAESSKRDAEKAQAEAASRPPPASQQQHRPPPPPPPPRPAAPQAGPAAPAPAPPSAQAERQAARLAEMRADGAQRSAAEAELERLRTSVRASLHVQYLYCPLPLLLQRLGYLPAAELGIEARVRKAYLKAALALHPDAMGRRPGVTPAELVRADETLKLINSKKASAQAPAVMEA